MAVIAQGTGHGVQRRGINYERTFTKYLAGNEYPGRGIVLGRVPTAARCSSPTGSWAAVPTAATAFEPIEGGIRTVAADPAKLEDPHLIIYNAVLTLGRPPL